MVRVTFQEYQKADEAAQSLLMRVFQEQVMHRLQLAGAPVSAPADDATLEHWTKTEHGTWESWLAASRRERKPFPCLA